MNLRPCIQLAMGLAVLLGCLLADGPLGAQPAVTSGDAEVDDPGMAGHVPASGRRESDAVPGASTAQSTAPSAPAPSVETGSEDIADPDDADDWAPSRDDQSSAVAQAPGKDSATAQTKELLTWWARATVRLGFDTQNTGPRSEAAAGIREDVLSLVTDTALSLQIRPHDRIRLQAGGRLRLMVTARQPEDDDETYVVFNGSLHRTDFEAIPGEIMIELSTRWIDLQAGLIRTVWGANDLVNPNDILTAKELRFGVLADAEVMQLPVLSAKVELNLDKLKAALVWQPIFTPHQIELFGGDHAVLGANAPRLLRVVGDLAERMADDTVESQWQTALISSSLPRPFAGSTIALRLSGTVAGWDLAAHYAYGFERLPVLRLHSDLVKRLLPYLLKPLPGSGTDLLRGLARSYANAPLVESVYLRQHHLGLSVSKILWRVVLDGDVAFVSRQAEPLDDGQGLPLHRQGSQWSTSVDTPVLSYTVGGRYTMGQELLVKLEWWHQMLIHPLSQPASEREDLLMGGPHRGGLALLCRYAIPRMDVTLQLLAHSEFFHGSVILVPQADYRVGQHLSLFLGGTFYAGNKGPGALYDNNDQVYIGFRGVL